MAEPHPLDGVRPRAASCERCGYRFGGVPIVGGVIICPECAHANRFDLVSRPSRPQQNRRLVRSVFLFVLGVLLVTLVLAALI